MKIDSMFFKVGTALPFIELKRKHEYKLFLFYSPCKTKPFLGKNLVAPAAHETVYTPENAALATLPSCWSKVASGARRFMASARYAASYAVRFKRWASAYCAALSTAQRVRRRSERSCRARFAAFSRPALDFFSATLTISWSSRSGANSLTQTISPTTVFGTANYGYDALDNLTSVNVTGGSQTRNHTYTYDTTKRLTQIKQGTTVVANLTYDVQGNLASKGPSGAVQNYTFDLGNRLRSVPNKETGYEYDGHGRRVYANTVGSGHILSQYAIDGKLLYQENHKLGKRIDYIYLGTRLVAQRERPLATSTATLKYQHTDALGSPIAVTNPSKVTIETSEYEPYGQLVNKPCSTARATPATPRTP